MVLEDFYEELKTIADEAIGGFAIDSMHPAIKKKKEEDEEINPLEEKRIMIDFDKTIYPYKSGWNGGVIDGEPYEGAKESIDDLKKMGYEIFIFSCRASQGNADEHQEDLEDNIQNLKNYLVNKGIYFDKITGDKLIADFYVDDKSVYIKDGNWKEVMTQIKKREKSL